ncbi:hypothetical protein IMZ48_31865 [Candidatus Bathyarchaeota archaeon]|nr:hypothetical protein [Candidatus Bathyarchaeota archaeon]
MARFKHVPFVPFANLPPSDLWFEESDCGIHVATETPRIRALLDTISSRPRPHNRHPRTTMSGPPPPPPPRAGLSLYANLLEPATDPPAPISSAPVLYNETGDQQPAKNPGPPLINPHAPTATPLTPSS